MALMAMQNNASFNVGLLLSYKSNWNQYVTMLPEIILNRISQSRTKKSRWNSW